MNGYILNLADFAICYQNIGIMYPTQKLPLGGKSLSKRATRRHCRALFLVYSDTPRLAPCRMSDPDIYPKKAILSIIFSINVAKDMQNAFNISFI